MLLVTMSSVVVVQRRLDFDIEEIPPEKRFINIRQQGLGSTFTFYSYIGSEMKSEETPKCLDLVYWPPKGMTFVGMNLVVIAYVFSNGLDMSNILLPDLLAHGSRDTL
ncbi:hypothetical protein PIB30_073683 [Stylosanthes scabra]|uniref:Uncharacterized protein n=1 Tax=Stylosanthes scabra TaxID=79078 RepID=A0ABU6SQS3_9FABA|nr:hypothetical protein [Stylosanthes scabra]